LTDAVYLPFFSNTQFVQQCIIFFVSFLWRFVKNSKNKFNPLYALSFPLSIKKSKPKFLKTSNQHYETTLNLKLQSTSLSLSLSLSWITHSTLSRSISLLHFVSCDVITFSISYEEWKKRWIMVIQFCLKSNPTFTFWSLHWLLLLHYPISSCWSISSLVEFLLKSHITLK
jgi:hypothetical protein